MVWSCMASAYVVEVQPQPAWQCKGAPSGLPSEMNFAGHTCFLLNKSVKSQVSVGSKQDCTRAMCSGFFMRNLRDKQAHLLLLPKVGSFRGHKLPGVICHGFEQTRGWPVNGGIFEL